MREFEAGKTERNVQKTGARARSRAVLDFRMVDFGYAIRTLGRTPAFTLIAVLTIALGIAGNTAIFSAIDEQVLRSLPVSHPEQLMELEASGAGSGFPIPVFEHL